MNQKKMQNEKIILSISLLVSNRIDTIRKCMESLKPILEALPSELIAVDTVEVGMSDGSIDVVREYTEKIVPFAWCDDFAAARNAGLEKARGEWFMYIDDDEWLEDASPIIAFFRSGEYKKYKYATYTVRNYTNLEGTRWVDTLQGRLFPIDRNTLFVGRIHEAVSWQEPACTLPCYAHHYGYAFQTAADKNKHIARNLKLLEKEYEQDRGNLRTAAHLIQEYEGSGRFEDSLKVIRESCIGPATGNYSKFWHFLKLHEVLGLICLKDFNRAYEKGKAYLQGEKLLMGAETGMHCIMAEVCDIIGKDEESMKHLEIYLEMAERIVCREDLPAHTVLDISQLWGETNVKKAYARGVNVAYRLGNLSRAVYYARKIDWREKELQILDGTVDNTFHLFEKLPYESWMTEIMDAILERGFSQGGIDNVLSVLKVGSMERRRILHILALCKNRSAQICIYRTEYAALTKDRTLMCQALQDLADNPEGDLLMMRTAALRFMQDADINGGEYVGRIPFYRWHACIGQWAGEKPLHDRKKECFLWQSMMPADPLYFWDMEAALREAEVQEDIGDDKEFDEIYQSLLDVAEKFHQVYSRIYHPDVFAEGGLFTILPPEAQFAEKYLTAAKCLEQEDEKGFIALVREAGICYPSMGEVCKLLLEKYRDEQGREGREARAELAVLIRTLKEKAEGLRESGYEEEARAIISQILQIQPDKELAERYHIR